MEAYWVNKWENGETGRELYRLALKILKQRLRVHKGLLKAFSATIIQICIGKVALKSYLRRIKHAPDLRCMYRNK
jgi:hypothetical protein